MRQVMIFKNLIVLSIYVENLLQVLIAGLVRLSGLVKIWQR